MNATMNLRKASKVAQRNKQEIVMYGAFTGVAIMAAITLTGGFSALLSLSSGMQCLGFALLLLQAQNRRDVSNVSLNSLKLYVIALCFRLFATLQYKGYQPMDVSGTNGLYHTAETMELVLAVAALLAVKKRHDNDCCAAYETSHNMVVLLVICAVLAPLTHAKLNNDLVGDITWIMGLYVETVAMIPQLYMLQRAGGEVESLHGHYIASMFASRLVTMYFWSDVYVELRPSDADSNVPGSMVMGAQALQLVVFGDFMYMYMKSIRNNRKLIIEV
jgi:hypothetical protein